MSTSFLSPGVYVREIDFSLYVPNLSTTAVGCVGYATKGPINQPQYITNPVQFSTTFGEPTPSMSGPYAALQFLSMGRQMWYVRVAEANESGAGTNPYTSLPASVVLSEASTKAKITGKKTNVVSLTYSTADTLTFKVDGTSSVISFTWTLVSGQTITKSISEIANDLNKNANFAAYFIATLSPTGALAIERLLAGSSHGFQIAGNALTPIFGSDFNVSAPPTAWGTGTVEESAYILGNQPFPSPHLSVSTGDKLGFNIKGSVTTITLPDTADYDLTAFVDLLNAQAGFTAAKLQASAVADTLFISSTDTAVTRLMLSDVGSGDIGTAVFGKVNKDKTITGYAAPATAITSNTNTLKFRAIKGSDGTYTDYSIYLVPAAGPLTPAQFVDAINLGLATASDGTAVPVDLTATYVATVADTNKVLITYTGAKDYVVYDVNSTAFAASFGQMPYEKYQSTVANDVLTITATSDGTWGNKLAIAVANVDAVNSTFDLNVYERGYLVERFEKLVKTPDTSAKYVETAINGVSTRITVVNDIALGQTLLPAANVLGTTTALTGGLDGVASVMNPSTFIGYSDATATTGLQLFRNPEQVDVNLLMVPGIASAPVINAMVDICVFRHDCMALVDPPFGLKPQEVVDWANGAGVYASEHAAFNTSYAALYWPWLQIYDPVNAQLVWTAPSGHISYVYAYTDYNSETWFSPAGLNRGHLSTPVKTEYIPTLGERDLLYQSNVNPIATFIKDGINVWGQKTLQRTPTALDRVNVRRLMLYLEKVVATAVRTLTFEPSDKTTWIQFINLVEPFLESVKSRRGVTEFKVVCDETTNTSDVIDRNEMQARIYIRPTKAAEFISIDFVLTDSGTAFSELVY
jgi:phage tail sheath protein FI